MFSSDRASESSSLATRSLILLDLCMSSFMYEDDRMMSQVAALALIGRKSEGIVSDNIGGL